MCWRQFYGNKHAFAGEIRVGEVSVEILPAELGFAIDIGDIAITECQMIPRPGVHWHPLAALIAHDAQVAAVGITTVLDAVCVGRYEDSVVRTPEILGRTMRTLLEVGADPPLRAQHPLHIRLEIAHEYTLRYLRDTPCVVAMWRSGKRVA